MTLTHIITRSPVLEVLIMSFFKEPSVVTFYQAWTAKNSYVSELDEGGDKCPEVRGEQSDDSESDLHEPIHVIIQMETCMRTVEDISSIDKREINMEKVWTLFEKITEAVECIHQKGVIHRDLKPSNIFIGQGGEVKIGDFGHSCWADSYNDGKEGTPDRGTRVYAAPELYSGQVTCKVDIYSLGIIYLEIFHPFGSDSERAEVLCNLKLGTYPNNWMGETVLLEKMTALCPLDRASANDVLEYIGERRNF